MAIMRTKDSNNDKILRNDYKIICEKCYVLKFENIDEDVLKYDD